MNEEIITLNGVNFKIDENSNLIAFKESKKSKLSKRRQELYSWNWFYMNSKESLYATRYHQIEVMKDGEKFIDGVYINDNLNSHYGKAIYYSQRYKDDRDKIAKVNLEIEKNWNESKPVEK